MLTFHTLHIFPYKFHYKFMEKSIHETLFALAHQSTGVRMQIYKSVQICTVAAKLLKSASANYKH